MSVAVVGFDVGNYSSYVAVAKGGGIETIDNEYSDRCTPTCVSFGQTNRSMGAAAKQQGITNINNTIFCFPRLLGKLYNDPAVQKELPFLPFKVTETENGKIGIEIAYMNEKVVLTPEQIMAAQLTKLKDITRNHLNSQCIDVVINVPNYYSDSERRAMHDASRIAGLNCVRLVNDTTAVGIAYGIYNKDLPEPEMPSRIVAFVLMGYSNLQVALCAFNKGKMKVLASTANPNLGGRDLDLTIFKHIGAEINAKYKLDVFKSPKASVRLLQECEKLKKLMSANSTKLPLNIECFMEDKDISASMQRPEFEALITKELNECRVLLQDCLAMASLKASDVTYVELVGGSTRVPSIKNVIQEVFGQEGRTTLNSDEAVARGCALQAAICSPAFKVREFNITDVCPYAVLVQWEEEKGDTDHVEVFPQLYNIPSSRQIELNRRSDFSFDACYAHPDKLPNTNKTIGRFNIKGVKPQDGEEKAKIKIKVRMNSNGIFTVSHAQQAEKHEKQVEEEATVVVEKAVAAEDGAPPTAAAAAEMDVEDPLKSGEQAAAAQKPKKMVTKLVTRYRDLTVEPITMQLNEKQLNECTERENKMIQQDKMECERSHAKNALEEYIYEMRDKLGGPLERFVLEADRETLISQLTKQEDWLYDEGENCSKSHYVERLDLLRKDGDRYIHRFREFEMRQPAMDCFGKVAMHIEKALASISAAEEHYNHLTSEDVELIGKTLADKKAWYEKNCNAQNALKLTDDPIILAEAIYQQAEALDMICKPILSKPKPVVEPPPVPPTAAKQNGEANNTDGDNGTEVNGNNNNNNSSESKTSPKKATGKETKSTGEAECMDLD